VYACDEALAVHLVSLEYPVAGGILASATQLQFSRACCDRASLGLPLGCLHAEHWCICCFQFIGRKIGCVTRALLFYVEQRVLVYLCMFWLCFLQVSGKKRIYPVDSRQAMERLYVVFGVQSTMAFLLQSSHSKIRSWMNATSPGHVAERRVPIVQLTQRHPNRRQSLRSSLISVDATQTCQTSHSM